MAVSPDTPVLTLIYRVCGCDQGGRQQPSPTWLEPRLAGLKSAILIYHENDSVAGAGKNDQILPAGAVSVDVGH